VPSGDWQMLSVAPVVGSVAKVVTMALSAGRPAG
jgi:hypothetical protein